MNRTTELDLGQLKCPLPVLKIRKFLSRLNKGDKVAVKTTDPMSDIDIPHFCQENGHRLAEKSISGEIRTFLIEKG